MARHNGVAGLLRQVSGTYVIAGGSRDESVSRSHDVCPTRRVPLWTPLLARRSAQGDNGESLIMHPLKAHSASAMAILMTVE